MILYGIQVEYRFNEVSGLNRTVLRKLYKKEPDSKEIEKLIGIWLDRNKYARTLFTIDEKTVKGTSLDFEIEF